MSWWWLRSFLLRGPDLKRSGGPLRFSTESDTVRTITLAGRELAPELIPQLVARYHEAFPHLRVNLVDGGTVRALEAMANQRAAVGLLYRPPTREEKAIVYSAVRDSVLYFPVALGGIAVLANDRSGLDSLAVNDLRHFLRGEHRSALRAAVRARPEPGVCGTRSGRAWGSPRGAQHPDSRGVPEGRGGGGGGGSRRSRAASGIASTLSLPDSAADPRRAGAIAIRGHAPPRRRDPSTSRIGYGEYPAVSLSLCRVPRERERARRDVRDAPDQRSRTAPGRSARVFCPRGHTSRTIYLTRRPLGARRRRRQTDPAASQDCLQGWIPSVRTLAARLVLARGRGRVRARRCPSAAAAQKSYRYEDDPDPRGQQGARGNATSTRRRPRSKKPSRRGTRCRRRSTAWPR